MPRAAVAPAALRTSLALEEDEVIVGIPQTIVDRPRRLRRSRLIVSAAAVAAAPALTACAANFNAPTNEPYQPAAGISDRSGEVYALDTLVVANSAGDGTVVSSLVNQESDVDTLTSFSATDSSGHQITAAPLSQPISLPAQPSAQQSVQVGTSGELRLSGDNLVAGQFVTLTFTFENAAPVTVGVPVVPSDNPVYADVPVGAASSAPESSGESTG